MNPNQIDQYYLQEALKLAQLAEEKGEIPIGALIVFEGEVIAKAHNRTITDHDPSAHAEIVALREAGKILANHRMAGASLYVTLEPCIMCTGALLQARISRLIFGAYDERVGGCGSAFDLTRHPHLNHHIKEIKGGVLAEDCRTRLIDFFKKRRK